MPQHRVLCKYYLQGACLKGESCQFSHSFSDPANNVCTFYQRGCCSYGSRCRYEHVKLSKPQLPFVPPPPPPPPSSNSEPDILPNFSNLNIGSEQRYKAPPTFDQSTPVPPRSGVPSPPLNAWQRPYVPPAAQPTSDYSDSVSWDFFQQEYAAAAAASATSTDPADIPICSYAAAGFCPYGADCSHVHGELCDICNKYCLHPYRPGEREEHREQCERNQKRLERLRMSQDIECSVCLERVLSKPSVSERKFGLLSGCDHPFCISCIRDWRGGSHPGMDLDTIVRACPVCRVSSHYVIPSVVWYSTPEEKQDIVAGYKNKLSSIDCKHFNLGNGTCPFGTSCFYRHAYSDGRTEEVKLRHLGAADGSTVIAKNIRLSDFLINNRR